MRSFFLISRFATLLVAGVLAGCPKAHHEPAASTNGDQVQAPAAPTRVAVLHFGPPPRLIERFSDELGVSISPDPWREAIPLLEADGVTVVIVAVNSGGGSAAAVGPFIDVFEREFKPRFRTVAWISKAAGNAALAVLPLDEFVFLPDGYWGWTSCIPISRDVSPERLFAIATDGARLGKRSAALPRALLQQSALSADIDPHSGVVSWREDEFGQVLVNRAGDIFGLSPDAARKLGVSVATAANKYEVALALGLTRVEWAGADAARLIDDQLRLADALQKRQDTILSADPTSLHPAREGPAPAVRRSGLTSPQRIVGNGDEFFRHHREPLDRRRIDADWLKKQRPLLLAPDCTRKAVLAEPAGR